MQFASFVALAASFVAVQAVLQDGAQCLSNWTSIGDFCDVSKGLACVATGWGNGFCESYKCSTTLAAATSTINAFPVTVTSPSVTSTIYTTTTKQNFCDCPPYLYSTTTAYVTATPTSTQAFWGDCKTTGDCQKGLDCVPYYSDVSKCFQATCVDTKLGVVSSVIPHTVTVAPAGHTLTTTATVTTMTYTNNPSAPVCSCVGAPPTTTITYYSVTATPTA